MPLTLQQWMAAQNIDPSVIGQPYTSPDPKNIPLPVLDATGGEQLPGVPPPQGQPVEAPAPRIGNHDSYADRLAAAFYGHPIRVNPDAKGFDSFAQNLLSSGIDTASGNRVAANAADAAENQRMQAEQDAINEQSRKSAQKAEDFRLSRLAEVQKESAKMKMNAQKMALPPPGYPGTVDENGMALRTEIDRWLQGQAKAETPEQRIQRIQDEAEARARGEARAKALAGVTDKKAAEKIQKIKKVRARIDNLPRDPFKADEEIGKIREFAEANGVMDEFRNDSTLVAKAHQVAAKLARAKADSTAAANKPKGGFHLFGNPKPAPTSTSAANPFSVTGR